MPAANILLHLVDNIIPGSALDGRNSLRSVRFFSCKVARSYFCINFNLRVRRQHLGRDLDAIEDLNAAADYSVVFLG